MENNNMYLLVPKTLWNTIIPVHAYDYYVNNGTDDAPDIVSYTPTFSEVSDLYKNNIGDTIFSNNWDDDQSSDATKYAVLKGEFAMILLDENADVVYDVPGELTVLLQAGVIPLTHAQVLRVLEKWNAL
jgi:hypothetical protein